jgi:hypothetical protein
MTKFRIGDCVEWTSTFMVPACMRQGTIVRVIPRPELPDDLNEYDVQFPTQVVRFYEKQLRRVHVESMGSA